MQQRNATGERRTRERRPDPAAGGSNWHPPHRGLSASEILDLLRRNFGLRQLALCVIAVLALPGAARASGDDLVSPQQMQSGSLLLRMASGYRVATRINSDIELTVSGLTARVALRQRFRNDGQQWVEGVYVFPLPDGAAVDRFRMHVGERVIEGEIREKEAAAKAYAAAKAEGKRASLVNQQRANLFTTAIANIAPGEEVTIEIGYLETVRYEDETFSLRLPLTLTPRFIPGAALPDRKGSGWSADTDRVPDGSLITPPVVTRSRDHRVTLRADIDAGVPLDFVASRYHPVRVEARDERYEVRLSGNGVAMDHDIELLWRPVRHAAPRAMVFSETVGGEPHFLFMLLPPDGDEAPPVSLPREVVFVIDTSGSMHGASMEQAKSALTLALDDLTPVDRFNIVQFDSVTRSLFPGAVAASEANRETARDYIDGLVADGGTEMLPALERALAGEAVDGRLRQVVFITDGSVGNEDELFNVIERRLGGTRLFTVGIGSAPNGWFMQRAAEAGRGASVTISAGHEVAEKMGRLFRKLALPRITDIRVEWPDGVSVAAYPATVPDLYAGEPVVIRARLDRATRPGDQLRISGQSVGGAWGAELPLSVDESSAGVAAMWARARLADLADAERRGADAAETRAAIVGTALKHRLVSKYTSFVAVDKTPVRPVAVGARTEQVPNLLPWGQSHQAIFGFPATATAAGRYRATGVFVLLLATLLLMHRVWTGRGYGDDTVSAG